MRDVARQDREGTLWVLRAGCVGRTPRACDRAGPPPLPGPGSGGIHRGTDDLPSGREGTAERPSAPASPACPQLRTIPRPEGWPCPAGPPSAQRGQAGRGRLLGAVLQLHIRRAPQALGTMSRPQVFVQEERRAPRPPPPIPHSLRSRRDGCWPEGDQSESRGDGVLGTLSSVHSWRLCGGRSEHLTQPQTAGGV